MAEVKVGQSAYQKIHEIARVNLLSSVRVYPENVTFNGQDQGEVIILFLRQHPIILVVQLFKAVLIFALFMMVIWLFSLIMADSGGQGTLGIALFIMGGAITISVLFYEFLKWYYTVTIITSTRLIDLNFHSIMDSEWSTTTLMSIQDISYNVPGFFGALFDIATLKIMTASHKEHFMLPNLPRARDVQDIIMDLVENEKQNGTGEEL